VSKIEEFLAPLTVTIRLHLPILKSEAASINKRLLPEDKEMFRQKIKKRTSKGTKASSTDSQETDTCCFHRNRRSTRQCR